MKIWILHDSIYGNGERLSRILANLLSKKHVVKIGYISNIAPESIIAEMPDMIIFGSAIRFGEHSRTLKQWFSRYVQIMKRESRKLSYTFLFYTHVNHPSRVWKHGRNALQTLKRCSVINQVFGECVSAQVHAIEGPLCEGVEEKFKRIADVLDAWLQGAEIDYYLQFDEKSTDSKALSHYFRFLHLPNPRSNKLF